MRYNFVTILLSVIEIVNGWQSLRKLNEKIDHLENIVSGLESLQQKQEKYARQMKNLLQEQRQLGREQERKIKGMEEFVRNQTMCACDQRSLMKTQKQNKEKEKEILIPLQERDILKDTNTRRETRNFYKRVARETRSVSSQGMLFYYIQ